VIVLFHDFISRNFLTKQIHSSSYFKSQNHIFKLIL